MCLEYATTAKIQTRKKKKKKRTNYFKQGDVNNV